MNWKYISDGVWSSSTGIEIKLKNKATLKSRIEYRPDGQIHRNYGSTIVDPVYLVQPGAALRASIGNFEAREVSGIEAAFKAAEEVAAEVLARPR